MNEHQIKRGATEKSLHLLFIIFLLFTFLAVAGSFFLKHSITQKLDKLSAQLKAPSQGPQISDILLELNSAENDFQQANLPGRAGKLTDYKLKLKSVFSKIDTVLNRYQTDSAKYFAGSKQQIAHTFEEKLKLSQHVFDLRQQFDSLLNATTPQRMGRQLIVTAPNRTARVANDTTVDVKQDSTKRGLLKRLKDAIVNKNQSTVKVVVIHDGKGAGAHAKKQPLTPESLLGQLKQQNGFMLLSNEQLVGANLNMLATLHQLLLQLRDINQLSWERSRNTVLSQYQSTTSTMNTFIGVAIIMLLLFVLLLIVYIRKAIGAEQHYLDENNRAVALAAEKSEVLAIMSHEIRNPLTAITGTIYMLNRTPLTPDQQKKVSAINLSSAMLLETVNNILDANKLEHQQGGVLGQVTFSPFTEMTEAMETMRFMAERKGITLQADFAFAEETLVNGDAFRLKQVMLNLISNAIKYTDKGSVTVVAAIERSAQAALLKVTIKDTGIGIPKDQQAKLFTRYYQVDTKQGKPGTGLGLFLCKQLVELQHGTITVESDAGQGCAITFAIPYQQVA